MCSSGIVRYRRGMSAERWDHHATTYDSYFAPLTGFIARAMLRMIEPRLAPTAKILDIACGTGALAIPAIARAERARREHGAGGHVVASDYSKAMLALTERAAQESGAHADLYRCDVQNGEALTYGDASFDAVYSCFGIFLFDDRRAGWREAFRVLAPGGTFVTSVWQGPKSNEMLRLQMAPVAAALPERLRAPKPNGWIEIADAESLRAELAACAPWSALRTYPFHASIAFGDWTVLWDAMQNNPVMGELLRQCTADELAVVRDAVVAQLRVAAGGDHEPLVMEAVCNIAIASK
jgi:ubiquinone/menaquinone biosynthesis C-methylase UbiE